MEKLKLTSTTVLILIIFSVALLTGCAEYDLIGAANANQIGPCNANTVGNRVCNPMGERYWVCIETTNPDLLKYGIKYIWMQTQESCKKLCPSIPQVSCEDGILISRGVDENGCPLPPICKKLECNETDNGKDYSLFGVCTDSLSNATWSDSCMTLEDGSIKLEETYCGINNLCAKEIKECLYGCSNGTCLGPLSSICPAVYEPVCGSDGRTYANSCYAENAGVKWKEGECSVMECTLTNESCPEVCRECLGGQRKVCISGVNISNCKCNQPPECIAEVSCITEGNSLGAVVPGNINMCCEGLKKIIAFIPTPTGACQLLVGNRGYCTKCGDGICKDPENICNCPLDCKTNISKCNLTDADCPKICVECPPGYTGGGCAKEINVATCTCIRPQCAPIEKACNIEGVHRLTNCTDSDCYGAEQCANGRWIDASFD